MYRIYIMLVVLALLPGVLFAASSLPSDDPVLDKPVTLAVKGEAFRDVVPIIVKQTGVHLRVSKEIADQKCTIFVDGKPLREVMAGLETVFLYRWMFTEKNGQRTYELCGSARLRSQKVGLLRIAVDKAREDFETTMQTEAQKPVKSKAELIQIQQDVEVPASGGMPPAVSVGNLSGEQKKRAWARLYLGFSPSLREAFHDGCTICYALDSPEPEWQIPAALQDEFREGLTSYWTEFLGVKPLRLRPMRKDYPTLNIEMTAGVSEGRLRVDVLERLGKWGKDGVSGDSTATSNYVLYDTLLWLVDSDMRQPLPRSSDSSALDTTISYSVEDLKRCAALSDPECSGRYMNRSDLLQLLHEKLGVQVISDHYSRWYVWGPDKDRNVTGILDSFSSFAGLGTAGSAAFQAAWERDPSQRHWMAEQYPRADWGWDGKYLYMRARDDRGMDAREIPNSKLRRWQTVSKEQGWLGLDEIAEIEALTDEQRIGLKGDLQARIDGAARYFGLDLSNSGMERSPSLRLYGLLSPTQREQALEGELSTAGFTQEQKTAVMQALADTFPKISGTYEGDRVGIYYQRAWRVDKPDAAGLGYPVSMRLRYTKPEEGYVYKGRMLGKSLDEALKSIPDKSEHAKVKWAKGGWCEVFLRQSNGVETHAAIGRMPFYTAVPRTAAP